MPFQQGSQTHTIVFDYGGTGSYDLRKVPHNWLVSAAPKRTQPIDCAEAFGRPKCSVTVIRSALPSIIGQKFFYDKLFSFSAEALKWGDQNLHTPVEEALQPVNNPESNEGTPKQSLRDPRQRAEGKPEAEAQAG
eukprot:scaffold329910_cov49-Prasinocladus_malaysianus.AAC.1